MKNNLYEKRKQVEKEASEYKEFLEKILMPKNGGVGYKFYLSVEGDKKGLYVVLKSCQSGIFIVLKEFSYNF